MSEREEAGMRRLMRDLDEADWPAPELLARYATEPNRLSEEEKQKVERALATSSIVADELATLRGFDFARLDADRDEARDGAEPAAIRRFFARWLARPQVWVALTAAALMLAYGLSQSARDGQPVPSPAPTPQLARSPQPPTPAEAPIATQPEPESAIAPAPEPAAALARAEERPEERAVEVAETPSPAPADERPASPPDEILLAMAMPDYRPAYGVEVESSGEWIVRGTDPGAPHITLLAPAHVVRSCTPTPILHWSLDRVPATGRFFLNVVDAQDEPIVLDRPLEFPTRAGLQRLDLAALGVRLPAGPVLRWSIALREDEDSAPHAFDLGWLRVEEPDAAGASDLAARGEESLAAGHAVLGCYAEALESALRVRAAHPDLADAERGVARLAEQAGFSVELLDE